MVPLDVGATVIRLLAQVGRRRRLRDHFAEIEYLRLINADRYSVPRELESCVVRTFLIVLAATADLSFLAVAPNLAWHFGFRRIAGRFPSCHEGEYGWSTYRGAADTDGWFCPEFIK